VIEAGPLSFEGILCGIGFFSDVDRCRQRIAFLLKRRHNGFQQRPQFVRTPQAVAVLGHIDAAEKRQRWSRRPPFYASMSASLQAAPLDGCETSRLSVQASSRRGSMHVLTCASRKGGSGKTVCARHVAVAAMSGGYRTAIIDLDPMRGLTRWWGRRPEDGLQLVDLTPDGMPRETAEQRLSAASAAADHLSDAIAGLIAQGHEVLVVDTPPSADRIVSLAVAAADLVLVPVRPSPDDLDAIGETVDLVAATKKPMTFVVNSATRRARLTSDAAIALSQHGTVSPAVLHRSDIYAASALEGRTVGEADPKGTPAEEVAALWEYLAKRLGLQACKQASKPAGRPALRVVSGKVRTQTG